MAAAGGNAKDFNTRHLFRHLCAQGHVVMDVAYRLCPEVDAFGMLGDVKRAIAWMKENAEKYDVDPRRVATGGGSAGGHLALLAAYTPDHPDLTPDDVRDADLSVSAVVSSYGPVDMRAYYDHAGATLGETGEKKKKERKRDPNRDGISSRISEAAWRFALGDLFDRIKEQDFNIGHRQMMGNLLGGQPDEVPERYELFSPITHAGPARRARRPGPCFRLSRAAPEACPRGRTRGPRRVSADRARLRRGDPDEILPRKSGRSVRTGAVPGAGLIPDGWVRREGDKKSTDQVFFTDA
jgi:acetyl esterase/lipase